MVQVETGLKFPKEPDTGVCCLRTFSIHTVKKILKTIKGKPGVLLKGKTSTTGEMQMIPYNTGNRFTRKIRNNSE